MGLIIALGFLTALPMPRRGKLTPEALARALPWFPLVGALVGGILVVLDLGLALVLPAGARAALLLAATVLLTRGLHLDGLMDTCDGLFGSFVPERRLAIMHDSRVGAFGVLSAVVLLLVRYASLVALTGEWRAAALGATPAFGRWALVCATVAFPYGRDKGLGLAFKQASGPGELAMATVSAIVLGAAWFWPFGAAAILPAAAVTWLLARFALRRIPGLTGDVYGAINEIVEVLLVLLLLAGQTIVARR